MNNNANEVIYSNGGKLYTLKVNHSENIIFGMVRCENGKFIYDFVHGSEEIEPIYIR